MLRRFGRSFDFLRGSLPPARGLLPLLLLLIVWQLLQSGPSPYFPAPSQWWTATITLFNRDHLMTAFGATTITFIEGLALAIVTGTVLGVLVGVSDRAARALQPLFEFMRAIPPPVTVPVASLLIGYSESMKLTVIVLSALWPILLNATSAVRQIDPLLLDVARSFRLSPDRAYSPDHSPRHRSVAAAGHPDCDPARHRRHAPGRDVDVAARHRRADDSLAAQFPVERGLRAARADRTVRLCRQRLVLAGRRLHHAALAAARLTSSRR